MEIDIHEEYLALGTALSAFEHTLDWPDDRLFQADEAISKWTPAQHVYHLCVANGMMLKGIQLICHGGRRILTEGTMTEIGRRCIEDGVFPRGRGKAPTPTQPPEAPSRDDLRQALDRSRKRYEALQPMLSAIPEAEGYLPHVFFGDLTAAQWLRVARVHAEHHLMIVREIAGERV